jgi:hypothetical protein
MEAATFFLRHRLAARLLGPRFSAPLPAIDGLPQAIVEFHIAISKRG